VNCVRRAKIPIGRPDYKSCPEYEQLKLLLHSGKSATMLPSITASSSGHWNQDTNPDQHIAAKRLNDRHAFRYRGPRVSERFANRPIRQAPQKLLQQRQAFVNFL
jgi:hypothetical protein